MRCTEDAIPKNDFGLKRICIEGAEITLAFEDGTSTSSRLREEFLAKEAVRGAHRGYRYERYNAPLTDQMRDRGIVDLRIEEAPGSERPWIVLEAANRDRSVTIELLPNPSER